MVLADSRCVGVDREVKRYGYLRWINSATQLRSFTLTAKEIGIRRQTMDEEIKLNEYQKIIVKAAVAKTLMSKLRDVARCINVTKKCV